MDQELIAIRNRLIEKAEEEATRLYRMARVASKHGCSQAIVNEIREEANWLHTTATAYPDRLVHWKFEYEFKYAFKNKVSVC